MQAILRSAWAGLIARKRRLALSMLAIVVGVSFVAASLIFTDSLRAALHPSRSQSDELGFLTNFFLVFAGITLVVAGGLIMNSFTILVAQRRRELALLRAIGATRAQVRAQVLAEAVPIGGVGAVVGLGVGYGLVVFIVRCGIRLHQLALVVHPSAVLISLGTGLTVTTAAALAPARTATAVAPVAVLREDDGGGSESSRLWDWLGIGIGVAGVFALFFGTSRRELAVLICGALAVLVASMMATSTLAAPVVWLIGHCYRVCWGDIGELAHRNLLRNPRRTSATASSLMIGLALVTTISVVGASTKASLVKVSRADAGVAAAEVDQAMAIIYGLLGLAIVIAFLGIVNTLALSMIDRTRELGVLRALGLLRRQLRAMIVLEAVAISLLGSVTGIGVGCLLGAALQHSQTLDGMAVLAIPWGQLAGFLLAAVIASVVAATGPAHSAGKSDPLAALSTVD